MGVVRHDQCEHCSDKRTQTLEYVDEFECWCCPRCVDLFKAGILIEVDDPDWEEDSLEKRVVDGYNAQAQDAWFNGFWSGIGLGLMVGAVLTVVTGMILEWIS